MFAELIITHTPTWSISFFFYGEFISVSLELWITERFAPLKPLVDSNNEVSAFTCIFPAFCEIADPRIFSVPDGMLPV